MWPRVCTVSGREALIGDSRCKGMRDRAQNRQFVDQVTADWIGAHERDEVVRRLQAEGVSIGPVLDHAEVAQYPQFLEHESVIDMQHPRYGTLRTYGVVPKFSKTPAWVRGPAPDMGQHNEAVYRDELGLDPVHLEQLKARNII